MQVFIENEAGSFIKHHHNEKTLELLRISRVSRAYPFPYGFVLNTTAADGDNVDCFVLTSKTLHTGEIVECEPVGLMEQIEDGEEDHKILAIMPGEEAQIDGTIKNLLSDFVTHVFEHIPGKVIKVGAFHGRETAVQYLSLTTDQR